MRTAVILADGSEEMEAVIIIDVLRRAGLDVTIAGINKRRTVCSRGVVIEADAVFSELTGIMDYHALILPGGLPGTEIFMAEPLLLKTIKDFHRNNKLICAICAAPLVLQKAGITQGKSLTCHPSLTDRIKSGNYNPARVVLDGNILTSQGPGTALEFSLKIVTILLGSAESSRVSKSLVL